MEEKGPKTTITISLHKQDESTNWGPGLPNTTVEDYDLGQIKGKDKTIKVEEPDYTWTIYGKDILTVPDGNISLKITPNPEGFQNTGVDAFFGNTELLKFNIEHNGEFGFRAILDYKLGEQYAGRYANLFYVVGDGSFEYMGHSIVTEEGIANFAFDHASDYILAILEEEYTGQPLTTPEPEVTETIVVQTPAPVLATPSVPLMGYGASGESVVQLQQRLQQLGYYTGAVDGQYGNGTAEAVKIFQSQNGLSADGIAGEKTIHILFSANAKYITITPTPSPVYLTGENILLLVNRQNKLPEDFVPGDLVKVKDICGEYPRGTGGRGGAE